MASYDITPGAAVIGTDQNDLFRWSGGNASVSGGGDTLDPNPYQPYEIEQGMRTGDMLEIQGSAGVMLHFGAWDAGTARLGEDKLQFSGVERVLGTAGNDTFRAGTISEFGPDGHGVSIFAGKGDDNAVGSTGNDIIDMGPGNDTVWAGEGNDVIHSSEGDDLIFGGPGLENIRWGIGDAHWHNPGNDTVFGGDGPDLINVWVWDGGTTNGVGTPGGKVQIKTVRADGAFSGVATVGVDDQGGISTLKFYGIEMGWTHMGDDVIDASAAVVKGEIGINWNTRLGDDVIIGSAGNDTLVGDEGADTITGGPGNDQLWIGQSEVADQQADKLIFRPGDGQDSIFGYGKNDILDLSGREYRASETSAGTLLDLGGGDTIMLMGVVGF